MNSTLLLLLALLLSDEELSKKITPFLTPENISLLCKLAPQKEEPKIEQKESQTEVSEWLTRIMKVCP